MTPAPVVTQTREALYQRFGQCWREMRRGAASATVRDAVLGTGSDALDPGQWDTLDLISTKDLWRMGDIATALQIEPSTATRAVQRLIALGLAEHVKHGGDARVVHVSITVAGRAVHDDIDRRRHAFLDAILDDFDDARLGEFVDLLETFIEGMVRGARDAETITRKG